MNLQDLLYLKTKELMSQLKELFKNILFLIGFILGIVLLYFIISHWITIGFEPIFIFLYVGITIFATLCTSEIEDNDNTFMFLIGLGIPQLLIILLIFHIVDRKNKKQSKSKDSLWTR